MRALRVGTAVLAAAGLVAAAGIATAAPLNGDFETGDLTGWAGGNGGDFAVTGAFQSPPDTGAFQLVLTTSPGSVGALGAGAATAAAIRAVMGITDPLLETVEPAGFEAIQGSVVTQTFITGLTGFDLQFRYNFLSDETDAGTQFGDVLPDYAIVHIRNAAGTFELIQRITDADTEFEGGPFPPVIGGYDTQTGYRTYNLGAALAPDQYTVSFAVFDVFDGGFDSALAIDNVMLVPEPSSVSLIVLGLLGLAVYRRQQRD